LYSEAREKAALLAENANLISDA
jgi:hypothetical protein